MQKELIRGDIVISKQGHDQGRVYVVLEDEKDSFVTVVDGIYRTLDKPKRKRAKHLRAVARAELGDKQDDTVIKRIIKQWRQNV